MNERGEQLKTFTKFGSCVTSDCFNFMDINQLYPSYTHTGIPISNILDEANINILEEDIIADNFFGKKMLQTIFKHEPFSKYLENRQSDYFIFDLADERLPLQEWSQNELSCMVPVMWNTHRTSKNVIEKSENLGGANVRDWHFADRNKEEYKKKIKTYCEVIKSNYKSDRIIYLSIRQAKKFINWDKKELCSFDDYEYKGIEKRDFRRIQDEIIAYAENIVLENMPDIWKIEFPANVIADDKHHFGRHTLHFNHLYYEYASDCIKLITGLELNNEVMKNKINTGLKIRKNVAEEKFAELIKLFEE